MRLPAIILLVAMTVLTHGVYAQGLNPLPAIIQFESSGNPTATTTGSTSSGLAGELNGTWAEALAACGGACGTTAQFPTAASAPASVQIAATDALINSQGLQPWLCAGCDNAFAHFVAANGGAGAFQTSGLDVNPADFTSTDTAAGLSDFLSANGGISTGAGGDTLTTSPTTPPSGAASPSALPFEWVYDQVINVILNQVDTSIQTVESIASGPASTLLALAVAVMGVLTIFGEMDVATFSFFAIRAAMVIAFVQVGNQFYSQWVEGFFLSLPAFFAQAFSLTGVGGNPAQLFDQVLNGWTASILATWHSSGWSLHSLLIVVALGLVTVIIVLPSLVGMFVVFLISTFLLLVMLTIGPVMILALIFKATHRFFAGYVNVMVTAAIFALVVDIVLGIFSSVLSQIMGNFVPSGSPDTDMPGLFGLAITMLIMAFSMGRLPRLVESIGGAVSAVEMATVGRYMAGGVVADGARAGASLAPRMV